MFRPIYEPRTRAREYCDKAINIYTGCTHGCTYCYAPAVMRKTREEFVKASPRIDIVEATEKQLSQQNIRGQKIMLCFTCDPYPAEIDTTVTRQIISAIKESGNFVQILTKGGYRATEDFDLLGEGDSFGVTIACSESQRQLLEPNAAPISERLESLQLAKQAGIKTWVSCEPVYDVRTIYDLIYDCEYIDLYRIGKLNHYPSDIDWKGFGFMVEQLCKLCHRDYYIKEDLRKAMEDANG